MKKATLFISILLVGTSFNLMAASTVQMKACKMALLEEPKFQDLPMAASSVFQGKKENHARFTVRWEGLEANGNCKVSKDGYVKKVTIKHFHDGRRGEKRNDGGTPADIDGFYYDKHVGKWRDPDGNVCHTCTPENGFPAGNRHW